MKITALIAALFTPAALAIAYPDGEDCQNCTTPDPLPSFPPITGGACTPVSYQCRFDGTTWGWDVCDVTNTWVDGGNCAPTERCVFNPKSRSPYCVPGSDAGGGDDTPPDACTAAETRCRPDGEVWSVDVCDAHGAWAPRDSCGPDEMCTTDPYSGEASCVTRTETPACTPGTYQCAIGQYGGWGWAVCSVEGLWVWGGGCESSQMCVFNTLNKSPYCI